MVKYEVNAKISEGYGGKVFKITEHRSDFGNGVYKVMKQLPSVSKNLSECLDDLLYFEGPNHIKYDGCGYEPKVLEATIVGDDSDTNTFFQDDESKLLSNSLFSYFTDYVKGRDCRTLLNYFKSTGTLPLGKTIGLIAWKLCCALKLYDETGRVHGNVTPSNVVMSWASGEPMILPSRFTSKKGASFTPELKGELPSSFYAEGNPKLDQKLLGLFMYEMLTGISPFENSKLRSLQEPFNVAVMDAGDKELSDIAVKLINREFNDFYKVQEALGTYLYGRGGYGISVDVLREQIRATEGIFFYRKGRTMKEKDSGKVMYYNALERLKKITGDRENVPWLAFSPEGVRVAARPLKYKDQSKI